jgi:hypothetical protein
LVPEQAIVQPVACEQSTLGQAPVPLHWTWQAIPEGHVIGLLAQLLPGQSMTQMA